MRLVSPLLKHVLYPGMARAGLLRRHAWDGPAVVTYHGIFPESYSVLDSYLDGNLVTARSFRAQLRLLKTQYHVISPDDFLSWCISQKPLPPRSVLLTCDDGLRNVLSMSAILQDEALSCLFFVTGSSLSAESAMLWHEELFLILLDGPEASVFELPEVQVRASAHGREQKRALWSILVKKLSQFDSPKRTSILEQIRAQLNLSPGWNSKYWENAVLRDRFFLLTITELRALAARQMSIGAHTQSHPMLSQQSLENAWIEISGTRSALQQSLACNIWSMAYPFGTSESVGVREFEMAERAGYECAFVNVEDHFKVSNASFALPRIHVTASMSLPEFDAHVSGFYRSMRHRFLNREGIQCA